MKPCRHYNRKPRRDFFKKTALIGACAVLGGNRRRAAAVPVVTRTASRRGGRYRLTPHIRRYYERAGF